MEHGVFRVPRLGKRRLTVHRLAVWGLVVLSVLPAGCSQVPAAAKPAIGDSCLVGSWVLDHEENRSGYLYSGTPVPVTGLAGVRLTLGSDGLETEVFDGSAPLVGTTADGRVLSITIGGSVTYHIRADGHQYTETGTETNLPTNATIGGVRIADYQSHNSPGTGNYQCSNRSLTSSGGSGVQSDTWSRS